MIRKVRWLIVGPKRWCIDGCLIPLTYIPRLLLEFTLEFLGKVKKVDFCAEKLHKQTTIQSAYIRAESESSHMSNDAGILRLCACTSTPIVEGICVFVDPAAQPHVPSAQASRTYAVTAAVCDEARTAGLLN